MLSRRTHPFACRFAVVLAGTLSLLAGTGTALAAPAAAPGSCGAAAVRAEPCFVEGAAAAPARAAAAKVPQVAQVLVARPAARVEVERARDGRWIVHVIPRGGGRELARVVLERETLALVEVEALPAGEWPPRMGEREAVAAAAEDGEAIEAAAELGGMDALVADARYHDGCCWEVSFALEDDPDGEVVMQVDVADVTGAATGTWTGHQIQWPMARGGRRAFGGDANVPWLWFSLFALFAIVTIDWRRPRTLATVDALALVAMLGAHEAWIAGEVAWSTWLASGPLAWLAGRGAWMFARGVPAAGAAPEARPSPDAPPEDPSLATRTRQRVRQGWRALVGWRVPTMLLLLLVVLLAGVRAGVVVEGGGVVDVGYAGVAGARLELSGTTPYGNMPEDVGSGDTYGPLAYLAYVPAVAALDDPAEHRFGAGEELPAAVVTAIGADLLVVAALLLVGRRWLGRWRAGLLLALGWLACPWTLWSMASATNDVLVALAAALALLAITRPALRGALAMAGAAIKFAPALALPLLAHAGSARRARQAVLVGAGALAVLAASVAWLAWRGVGPLEFWDRTLGYQDARSSPFTLWGLHGLEQVRRALSVAVVVLAAIAAWLPRTRDARQLAAGLLAALAAAQLLAPHWFFFYLPWLVPPLLVVLLARRSWGAAASPAPAPQPRPRPSR